MQFDCEHVKEKLSLYIDDMLCDDEKEVVCAHLTSCDDCQHEYEFLSSIVKAANTMPALRANADLHAKIMHAATVQTKAKPARRSLWRMASGFAAAAAIIAISVISFGSLPGHPDVTTQPTPKGNTTAPITATASPAEATRTPQTAVAEKTATPPSRQQAASPAPAAAQEPATPALEDVPTAAIAENPAYASTEPVEPEVGSFSRTEETVVCYYIGEESYEEAVLILDVYEFDGLAYSIPAEEADALQAKLEGLSGYVRHTEETSDGETVRIALACE